MEAILHRITEGRLSDFKGLAIEGEIPVSEEILNHLTRLFIEEINQQKPVEESTEKTAVKGSLDLQKIIQALDEKNLEIKLRDKQLVVKLTARKY